MHRRLAAAQHRTHATQLAQGRPQQHFLVWRISIRCPIAVAEHAIHVALGVDGMRHGRAKARGSSLHRDSPGLQVVEFFHAVIATLKTVQPTHRAVWSRREQPCLPALRRTIVDILMRGSTNTTPRAARFRTARRASARALQRARDPPLPLRRRRRPCPDRRLRRPAFLTVNNIHAS